MIDLIERHQSELSEICKAYRVKRLELFGSAVDGTWNPAISDLDFLLEFHPDAGGRIFDGFFDLKADLERLFDRKVDLVMPRAIRNRYFLDSINDQRTLVYGE